MLTSIVSLDPLSSFITIFSAYTLTSFVLFRNPTLLHKKKKVAFLARHISHRGGAGEGYENTIPAFRRAVYEANTEMLEIDCHITKDGNVIVIHDSNLLRLTGVDKDVASLRYDELPPLKKILSIEFQPGEYFSDKNAKYDDRTIPQLEEVFKIFPHIPFNIDIKKNDPLLIERVSYLISKYKKEKHCVWGNRSADITEQCFKQNPKINLLFSTKKVIALLLYYYTGLLPFVPLKETHFEIFLPTIYKKCLKWQKCRFLVNLLICAMNKVLIRKALFSHLKRRGIQVYLWVLNEENEFEEAFRAGASGVMTDYPMKLTKFINNRKTIS